MNDKQVLQDVAFNPAAKCSPTATQCPRCNNPHNACDKDAQPAGKDAWLVEAERLAQLHACEKSLRHLGREDADETETLAALLAHLRSHPAEAQLEAARKDGERLDVLLRAITPTGQLVCGCYDPDDGDCDWSFIDLHGTPLIGHYDTPREAIDALAALEATTPEN